MLMILAALRRGMLAVAGATVLGAAAIGAGAALAPAAASAQRAHPPRTMRRAGSLAGLDRYLQARRAARERWMQELRRWYHVPGGGSSAARPLPWITTRTIIKPEDDYVPSPQHPEVGEAGVAKPHGRHLVVLRNGRLFTVLADRGELRRISTVAVHPRGEDPSAAWYEQLLVSGDVAAVMGEPDERTGTEIVLFSIDGQGRLAYRATYHLRAGIGGAMRADPAWLVNGRLVFCSWLYLEGTASPATWLPALRRWHPGAADSEFRPIVDPANIYLPAGSPHPADGVLLHTVTTCDPTGGVLRCAATSMVGGWGDGSYVSPSAVYLWVGSGWEREPDDRPAPEGPTAMVYRVPLNGAAPSALGVTGSPLDRFSFLESGDGHLNVMVAAGGRWARTWWAPGTADRLALTRLPLAAFGDGSTAASRSAYRVLDAGVPGSVQNRFVGRWLLYGSMAYSKDEPLTVSALAAVPLTGGQAVRVPVSQSVQRIEAMGDEALVIGTTQQGVGLSAVTLDGRPRVRARYAVPSSREGETRLQGFAYRPNGRGAGTLALPTEREDALIADTLSMLSTAVVYLRNGPAGFSLLGQLEGEPKIRAAAEAAERADCGERCPDWFPETRALSTQGRLFAFQGPVLLAGREAHGRIHEAGRVTLVPDRTKARR